MAFEQMTGPLDPRRRGDIQAAIVATTVANAMRSKKGRKAKLTDFLIEWDRRARQPWQEQLAVVEALNRQFKGKDLRRGERSHVAPVDGDDTPSVGA